MALAQITVFRPLDPAEANGVLDAVHGSLVESLQVPDDDPKVWVTEQPRQLVHPASRNRPDIFIQVTLFSGRSLQTKQRLHDEIAKRLEAAGIPPASVGVVMLESPRENWSVAGVPSDQVDLGFQVEI
jgi:phenylpyruvate tautomerase PptA (4-oxalocrotonate tautomerase family)